jgi:hypothetical protein
MGKNVTQDLANMLNQSVRGIDYRKLATKYSKEILERDAEDTARDERNHYNMRVSEKLVDILREKVAIALDRECAEVNGSFPVISVFEALQISKKAVSQNSRDLGLRNLVTYLNMKWDNNREADLFTEDYYKIKNLYSRNFPKSAACSVIESFSHEGYASLPVSKLAEIAEQIETQEDFDQYIREAGLHVNSPFAIKARKFIVALLNGSDDEDTASDSE